MKNWKKYPNFIKGMCYLLAGALAVTSIVCLWSDEIEVTAASNTLPGIEQLREDYISNTKTYRILEIVPKIGDGEIGYYIGGQEPFSKLYDEETNTYRTWQEMLLSQKDAESRAMFMNELISEAEKINEYYKEAGVFPFSVEKFSAEEPYMEYEENPPEDANRLQIAGVVKRGYLRAGEGEWDAVFTAFADRNTSLDSINNSVTTPYYKAGDIGETFSYTELKVFSENNPLEDVYMLQPEGYLEYRGTAAEVWEETEDYLEELCLTVSGNGLPSSNSVTGRDNTVSGGDPISEIWNGSSGICKPMFELVSRDNPVSAGDYVYLMSEAVYVGEGNGHYALVETVEREMPGEAFSYEATYLYFTGGITNNEVFKKEVFGLDEQSYDKLRVSVETVTPAMLKTAFENDKVTTVLEGAELFEDYDFIYINGGAAMNEIKGIEGSFSTANDITSVVMASLGMYISMEKVPCIFDLQPFVEVDENQNYRSKDSEGTNVSKSNLGKLAYFLSAPAYNENGTDIKADFYWDSTNLGTLIDNLGNLDYNKDISFVKGNVWFSCNEPLVIGNNSLQNRGLFSVGEYSQQQIDAGFYDVWNEIVVENMYLAEQQKALLDTKIYDASVFRYIINFKNQRQMSKEHLDVLVIEPAGRVSTLSAAEFSGLTNVEAGKITFHVMGMNEFVGHIEDLNATYDVIYFDSNTTGLVTKDGETDYNDDSMDGLLYSHVGDTVEEFAILSGLLDTDYTRNIRDTESTPSTLKETTIHRYSGNDLSVEKYNALIDYLDANYPIVISSGLLKEQGTKVDEKRVDNSSYLYEFLSKILADTSKRNIFVSDTLSQNKSTFAFYANRPKLSLYSPEYEDLIMTKEKYLADGETDSNVTQLLPVEGKYYLQFDFIIENDSAADFGDDYTCKLYLDANADGKFSEDYEELKLNNVNLVEVSTGQIVESVSKLKTGVRYQVSREVPDSFYGCITWQLEVSQTGCPSIRTQHKGYTKLASGEVARIKILQIYYHDEGRYINLEQSIGHFEDDEYVDIGGNVTQYFRSVAQNVSDDYILDITTISKETFEWGFFDGDTKKDPIILNDYDMLILGFSDGKDGIDWEKGIDTDLPDKDLTGENPIPDNNIRHFIESGKSVLFAHDMTSFTNVSDASIQIGSSLGAEYRIEDNQEKAVKDYYYEPGKGGEGSNWVWGYNINIKLRNLVGMDTYGVSSGSNVDVLRLGKVLEQMGDTVKYGTGDSTIIAPYKDGEKYVYGMPDVAFAPNSSRKETVSQVQGFSTYVLNQKLFADGNVSYYRSGMGVNRVNTYSDRAEKVNDGQITNYPYLISDMPTLAETHQQYYTLDFNADNDKDGETDTVVWYNLSGGTYDYAPGDVKNNYYIYSKGNVIYTGMGHSATGRMTDTNPYFDAVTEEEAKLFINTMIAAYNAGLRNPEILTMNAGGSTTDVVYNYYDFMLQENEADDNEAVIDYTDVSGDTVEVYFRVDDLNITQGTKEVELHYYMEVDADDKSALLAEDYHVLDASELPDAGSEVSSEKVLVEVTDWLLPANTYIRENGEDKSVTLTQSGSLYPETLYKVEIPLKYFATDKQGFRSSFYIGGRTVLTHSSIVDGSLVASYTPYVYAELQCVNVELFDLD
ncbi:MAG: DUF5057 domain-containing protein [Lachnospiraceae bacterium]|nr:DUF5057 domain-containing protein [Lachnospiraceae bacterium]